jgi:hypothetical protein
LADRRKTGALLGLTVVLAVIVVRQLPSGGEPSSAAAASNNAVASDGVIPAVPAGSAGQPAERVALTEPLSHDLIRDPFKADPSLLPPGGTGARGAGGGEVSGMPADPTSAPQDPAAGLVLQSTIYGDAPLACINGQVVRPNEKIAGFVVERIEGSRVVLGRDGVQLILRLE